MGSQRFLWSWLHIQQHQELDEPWTHTYSPALLPWPIHLGLIVQAMEWLRAWFGWFPWDDLSNHQSLSMWMFLILMRDKNILTYFTHPRISIYLLLSQTSFPWIFKAWSFYAPNYRLLNLYGGLLSTTFPSLLNWWVGVLLKALPFGSISPLPLFF